MELTRQTTLSFPADLYGRLAQLAEQRHSSVDDLVTEAWRAPYLLATRAERVAPVKSLATLNLPVGTPEERKRESVPPVEALR